MEGKVTVLLVHSQDGISSYSWIIWGGNQEMLALCTADLQTRLKERVRDRGRSTECLDDLIAFKGSPSKCSYLED